MVHGFAEQEAAEQIKKEKLAANVTPDYAASLMSPGLPVSRQIFAHVM